ncbi:hypothetical protein [Legionella brunensis]|uniref:Uncharacterized protein n=1 Tax=Legionella brunensis TaxID=29422 RepID=A0A0W0SP68_9GAMM|nr:hypothetical protein [Legionella brunensis]KTC85194.1 hypothetical protein Lbru_0990 [Legionella brunensis]
MPKPKKETPKSASIYEKNYYRERNKKIYKINSAQEQKKIDKHMQSHNNLPPKGVTREAGFSVYLFKGTSLEVNASLVRKKKTGGTAFILSKLKKKACRLPVSCIASTEHVISMQEKVEDFVSDSIPAESKKQVMYQILVRVDSLLNIAIESINLAEVICKDDDILTTSDVAIRYDFDKDVFVVELGTQVTDIQQIVRRLNAVAAYHIVSCDFEDIQLNDGVCLLKPDASNPIHALANIAQGKNFTGGQMKFFLERDAGMTSGQTEVYQDSDWTFNGYDSLQNLRDATGYPDDAHALRIFYKA